MVSTGSSFSSVEQGALSNRPSPDPLSLELHPVPVPDSPWQRFTSKKVKKQTKGSGGAGSEDLGDRRAESPLLSGGLSLDPEYGSTEEAWWNVFVALLVLVFPGSQSSSESPLPTWTLGFMPRQCQSGSLGLLLLLPLSHFGFAEWCVCMYIFMYVCTWVHRHMEAKD